MTAPLDLRSITRPTKMNESYFSNPSVLFVNIGWAESYSGDELNEGNHRFLQKTGDDCAELYAFSATEEGLYRCGIGRGAVDAARLDVVFVTRPAGEKGHCVVGLYFDVRWDQHGDGWVNVYTADVIPIATSHRPAVAWPGRMGMRRWAHRAGGSGTEHEHLRRAYENLLAAHGRTPGDSVWDEPEGEAPQTDNELLDGHILTEGDPTADEDFASDLAALPESRFRHAQFAALDPDAVELSGFRPGMSLRDALRNLLANKALRSIRLTAFRGNRGFFELVGLSELIGQKLLGGADVRMMFAPPHGVTLDLATWLERQAETGLLDAREFPFEGRPREMHVKLLLLEFDGNRRIAVQGSANATTAALCSNEEFSVAYTPSPKLGISDPFNWFDSAWKKAPPLQAIHFIAHEIKVQRRALFAFQQQAQHALSKHLQPLLEQEAARGGHGGGLLVLPTGAGKTLTTMRWLFTHPLARNLRVLWLSHRRELLQHALDAAKHELMFMGGKKPDVVAYGIDDAGVPRWEPWERGDMVLISSQRMHRALQRFKKRKKRKPPSFDLIVVDEAHRASASTKQYGEILKQLRHGARLGLTATPYRGALSDLRKFAELFTLVGDRGRGRPTVLFQRTRQQIEAVPLPGGAKLFAKELPRIVLTGYRLHLPNARSEVEFQKYIREFDAPQRNQVVIDTYFRLAQDVGPTLIFAVSREHANRLAAMINQRGGSAQAFHGGEVPSASSRVHLHGNGMDLRERAEILRRFGEGRIKVLICVQLLTEGLDVPNIAAVLLARPTMSTLLLTQMIGRGLRGPAVGGAETCFVVDFSDQLTLHQARHKHQLRVASLADARRFREGHEPEGDALKLS